MEGAEIGSTASPSPPLRRNRAFLLLWSGQAVSVLGARISATAYPLLVLAMTNSPAAAGLVGFAGTLPYILFQLPAGALVDRVDRKRLMIACDIGRGLALASLAAALWLGALTLTQVIVVAFVEGALFVFFRLAEGAAVRLVVPATQYPQALSQNEARLRGASLVGQPLGGILFDVGRAVPFLADAVSYLVSLATLLLNPAPFQEVRTDKSRRLVNEIRQGMAWLWHQRLIRATVLLAAGSNPLFQALFLVVIVLAKSRGATASVIGLMLGGFGLGGVLGSLASPWIQRRLPPRVVVIGAVWVWAALVPLIAVVSSPYALGVLFAAMAFVGAAWNVVLNTFFYNLVPDALIGRVAGVGSLLSFGTLPLGSLGAGLLLQTAGPVTSTLVLAGLMLMVALAATLSPSVRHAAGVKES